MKCTPFAVNVYAYVKRSSSHAQNTLHATMSRELMKLRIATVSIKLKVLIKFGALGIIYMSQKTLKCVLFAVNICMWKCSSSHAQNTLQPRHQSIKLGIMTISIKTKELNKFGTSEMMCAELRAKNYEMCITCRKRMHM